MLTKVGPLIMFALQLWQIYFGPIVNMCHLYMFTHTRWVLAGSLCEHHTMTVTVQWN